MHQSTHQYRDYLFTISAPAPGAPFTVDFPDVPEIMTDGATLTGAFANACAALDAHIESCHRLGLPLPAIRHHLIVEVA